MPPVAPKHTSDSPPPGTTEPPAVSSPAPFPVPRPLDVQPELQPAPAALMIPTGAYDVPGKHGTFGSQPITLSRDYPSARGHTGHGDITISRDAAGGHGGPLSRLYVRGEYLLWWMPGFATPVLATTNQNTDLNGYLGEPGTASIVGPGAFLDSTRSGFRGRAGLWLDEGQSCGIDAGCSRRFFE